MPTLQSPFQIWSSPGALFTGSNVRNWAQGYVTVNGTPLWVETSTSGYTPGSTLNYTISLATQDWIGDIQASTVALTESLVDPFGQSNVGNLAAGTIFSTAGNTGSGGLVYWASSGV